MQPKDTQLPASVNPLERGADQLLQQESRGYWATIWGDVMKRTPARMAWYVLLTLFVIGMYSPFLANHLPFVTVTPQEDGTRQFAFPLFGALSAVDWTLAVGGITLLWFVLWGRRLARRDGRAGRAGVAAVALIGLSAPVLGAAATLLRPSPEISPDAGVVGIVRFNLDRMNVAGWWWALIGVLLLFGAFNLVRGTLTLWSGRRDDFGRSLAGAALRTSFVGLLALVLGGAFIGTRLRSTLDTTDYYGIYKMNPQEGAWAIFAPLPHNFRASEAFLRSQGPLGPHPRITPSGGSDAVGDLLLTENDSERSLVEAFPEGTEITEDSRLSRMHDGEGVRTHRGRPDITLRLSDGREVNVYLAEAETIADVTAAVIEAGRLNEDSQASLVDARIDPQRGLIVSDLTTEDPDDVAQVIGRSRAADALGMGRSTAPFIETVEGGTVEPDTPVSALRGGLGLPVQQQRDDLTLLTRDLQRVRISLAGVQTLGDVMERFNEAGRIAGGEDGPKFEMRLDDASKRLVIVDHSPSRPRHWLGTDGNGSDVLSRLISATRVALSIGFVSTGIAITIGVTFGSIIGYFGGWVDAIGMRIIEIFMAIPSLFLLLTIIAFVPPEWNRQLLYVMMVVIGMTSWMGSARFVRAEFFRLREMDFVQAAKACGLPLRSVLFKHMLPNGVAPVLVDASFGVAAAILLETSLSFLGFGIKPPDPSWGQMLSEAVDPSVGNFYWWMAVFPGLMIFLAVFSFNMLGDAMRDAIDPKLRKAAAV